jgi:hypothetical protein
MMPLNLSAFLYPYINFHTEGKYTTIDQFDFKITDFLNIIHRLALFKTAFRTLDSASVAGKKSAQLFQIDRITPGILTPRSNTG